MLKVNDSKKWQFTKAVGALLRSHLHPPVEGEKERFRVCGDKISDL